MTVAAPAAVRTVALVGNPNCGKSTLFNRLTGLRQRVANPQGETARAPLPPATVEAVSIDLEPSVPFVNEAGELSIARSRIAFSSSAAPSM